MWQKEETIGSCHHLRLTVSQEKQCNQEMWEELKEKDAVNIFCVSWCTTDLLETVVLIAAILS